MSSDGPQYPVYPEQGDEGKREGSGSHPPPPGDPQPPPPPAGQSWPPPTPAYGQPAAPGAPTNQKAIWALVLGILGVLCCGIFTAIPALIVGILANKEIGASGGSQTGRGMAIAGIVLGIAGIIFSLLVIAFWGYVVSTPEFQDGFREGFEGTQ